MRVAFVVLMLFAALAACSDDDPRYGPPGGIAGRTLDFDDAGAASTADDSSASADGGGIDTGVPAEASAVTVFAALYGTITDPSTPPANSVCIPCHRDTQTPMFVKTTAELTRAAFLSLGFDNIQTGRFYNKGQHEGNPLTPLQQALARQWSAAEHGGD